MRADVSVAIGDTPLTALVRETTAATFSPTVARLCREWLSLQDAAAHTGYSEQQFSEFVKRGIAPKSVLFSRRGHTGSQAESQEPAA